MNELELHDVFRYRGLASPGGALFCLNGGPRTPRELEDWSNIDSPEAKHDADCLVVNDAGAIRWLGAVGWGRAALGTPQIRERQLTLRYGAIKLKGRMRLSINCCCNTCSPARSDGALRRTAGARLMVSPGSTVYLCRDCAAARII